MTTQPKPLRTPAQVKALIAKRALERDWQGRPKTLAMPYKPTLGIFKSSNLDFDPRDGLGHSYNWYLITKRIQGRLVLNSFAYSVSTRRHVSRLRSLFKQLGLRYIEIEAPRGLQDLDCALEHAYSEWARISVANEHARKPLRNVERFWRSRCDLLRAFGAEGRRDRPLQWYFDQARNDRKERLNRLRLKRALAKQHAEAMSRVTTASNAHDRPDNITPICPEAS